MNRTRAVVFNKERGIYEPKINEEDVVKEIMTRLTLAGFRVYREKERIPVRTARGWRFAGGASDGGHPDLHGWIPIAKAKEHLGTIYGYTQIFALPFYIECKNPNKSAKRPKQTQFILEAKADGVIAFFADSWDDVRENFAAHGIMI